MEKELLRQAFNAGVEYQKQFECKLAESYDKHDFDEWYDTVVLPQANVIKSVCPNCGSKSWLMNDKGIHNCNDCNGQWQTVL